MQPFQLLILESQTAKNRLRKTFELSDGCRSNLRHNRVIQGCGEGPAFLPRAWKRSGRINTKSVFGAMVVVIGIAAIGTILCAGNGGNENKQRVAVGQLATAVQENRKPVVFDAILKDQASCPDLINEF